MDINDIVEENLRGTIRNQCDLIIGRGKRITELEYQLKKCGKERSWAEQQLENKKWVSVEDRLPEIPEGQFAISVIVANYEEEKEGYGPDITECIFNGKSWNNLVFAEDKKHLQWEWNGLYAVRYWQPLPEPPEVE